jgi:hypothetical protein
MSEITSDSHTGTTRPRNHHRAPGTGDDRRHRAATSEEQRRKLCEAQKAYVETDPRWAAHRQKLADAQIARRMTLSPEEVAMILKMRARGRTFSYIQEEIGVCHDVIRRELTARGHPTARVSAKRRARRGSGFWRCFD